MIFMISMRRPCNGERNKECRPLGSALTGGVSGTSPTLLMTNLFTVSFAGCVLKSKRTQDCGLDGSREVASNCVTFSADQARFCTNGGREIATISTRILDSAGSCNGMARNGKKKELPTKIFVNSDLVGGSGAES